MKTALVIQHHRHETLGDNFRRTLAESGYGIATLDLFERAPEFDSFDAPDLGSIDLIIALGGPMSANDGLPALEAEMAYLKQAAESGMPVLDICLGAQLLARALGAVVQPTGGYQFGLRKLWISEEGHADPAFSKIAIPLVPTLHGESFSIPSGATGLAEGFILRRDSKYRRINMAFRYNNAYGVQFEPQLTLNELRVWNRELASDYDLLGPEFNPSEEARRNLREFQTFAPHHETQMSAFLRAMIAPP